MISYGWNSTIGNQKSIGSIISNMILLLEINKMEIQIDPHTLERALERGTTEEEIKDVSITGISIPAKYKREGKVKVYEFKQIRHGRFFEQKRVEVFFLTEGENIITVTVYVFYGQWED